MKTILLFVAMLFFFIHDGVIAQVRKIDSNKNGTSVTYRLEHPLHKIEATSKDAQFHAEVDTSSKTIKSVTADVDVMTFDSGNSNRDSHAMEVIDAITYPDVSFSGTKIDAQGDSLSVTGMLTFHGVTKEVVANVVQKWLPDELDVEGGFNISLTAFNIDRPSLLMIPVSDTLRFSLKTSFGLK